MASGTRMVAIFIGTTTVSSQSPAAAVLTWDLSSTPSGSNPIAASSSATQMLRSIRASTQSPSESSNTPASSFLAATATDFSQPYPPTYYKPESTESSSGLSTSLIVLSAVLFVAVLVVGWLVWRRFHRQRRNSSEDRSGRRSHNPSKTCPTLPRQDVRQSGVGGLTYSIPVAKRDLQRVVPARSIDLRLGMGDQEEKSAIAKLRLDGAMSSKALYSPDYTPKPPSKEKNRQPPYAPSLSPILPASGHGAGHRGEAMHT